MKLRAVITVLAIGSFAAISAAAAPERKGFDAEIARSSQTMLDEGRKIFRSDTFGSEGFWGDALQLHRAIAGEKNGGVGAGVSPKTALSVGLKVDANVLAARGGHDQQGEWEGQARGSHRSGSFLGAFGKRDCV